MMDRVGVWLGMFVVLVGALTGDVPYALMGLAYGLKCYEATL